MSIHKEHRQRIKARYEEFGLDSFREHEVLEMLLFYCIPRRDTNEIAHRLIERFGSVAKTLDAPVRELEMVEGMGHSSALFLKMLRDLDGYCAKHAHETRILSCAAEYAEYMRPYFKGSKIEKVVLLCMDGKGQVLACREVAEGTVNATTVSIRKIVEVAISEGATAVVLSHNHPSGVAIPSPEDVSTTIQVEQALDTIEVALLDHLIMDDEEFVSLAEAGKYKPRYAFRPLIR